MQIILICKSICAMPNPSDLPSQDAPTHTNSSPPRVDSRDLFRGHHLVEIEHAGQRYQLRLTRENKLILTK